MEGARPGEAESAGEPDPTAPAQTGSAEGSACRPSPGTPAFGYNLLLLGRWPAGLYQDPEKFGWLGEHGADLPPEQGMQPVTWTSREEAQSWKYTSQNSPGRAVPMRKCPCPCGTGGLHFPESHSPQAEVLGYSMEVDHHTRTGKVVRTKFALSPSRW